MLSSIHSFLKAQNTYTPMLVLQILNSHMETVGYPKHLPQYDIAFNPFFSTGGGIQPPSQLFKML